MVTGWPKRHFHGFFTPYLTMKTIEWIKRNRTILTLSFAMGLQVIKALFYGYQLWRMLNP